MARILFLAHRGQTAFLPAHQQAAVAVRTRREFAREHVDGAPPPQAPLEVAVDDGVVGRRLFGRLTETRHVTLRQCGRGCVCERDDSHQHGQGPYNTFTLRTQ